MSGEHHPSAPTFEPLTRPTTWRLVAGATIGSLVWLVALVVGAIVLDETNAIEIGLVIAGVSCAVASVVLALLRAGRRREERRYADGR
jgi:arginine exporter protein ArgO